MSYLSCEKLHLREMRQSLYLEALFARPAKVMGTRDTRRVLVIHHFLDSTADFSGDFIFSTSASGSHYNTVNLPACLLWTLLELCASAA